MGEKSINHTDIKPIPLNQFCKFYLNKILLEYEQFSFSSSDQIKSSFPEMAYWALWITTCDESFYSDEKSTAKLFDLLK